MKHSRGWMVGLALACCAALVLGAMAWLTRGVLAAERERSLAEARADLEERTRLALWRMDGEGAAILLARNRLSARDYPAAVAAAPPDPLALLHFEADARGTLKSSTAGAGPVPLDRLSALLARHPLPLEDGALLQCAAESGEATWQALPKSATLEKSQNSFARGKPGSSQLRNDTTYQNNSAAIERSQRAKVVDQTLDAQSFTPPLGEVGAMRAVWIAGELFLLRQIGGPDWRVQGIWLDSARLRERLRTEITDLLPNATLDPIENSAVQDPLALVSFPFRLDRHEVPVATRAGLGGALTAGWIAVLCAIAAVAVLVRGILRLSERRASFVSAVTHELRTPLTTFQLYADLLQSGAVKEEQRGHYFQTLHREARRLSHLVENVLAFSRIEKGSARATPTTLAAGELVRPMLERLDDRLREAGLHLICDLADPAWSARVAADPAAVEHVLFNLIDNAAKYAAGSSPAEVELRAQPAGRTLEILVRDHGPGIPPAERRRVFRAFHKSAAAAAESRPGVGLGLSLSRRLARAGRGELRLLPDPDGACFALALPLADPAGFAAGIPAAPP
jgi:signal transduction histidine kinase